MCQSYCPKCKECINIDCKYTEILKKKKEYYEEKKDNYKKLNADYYKENKGKVLENMKMYRESNKELLKEKLNKKVTCECGGRYTVRNKSTHIKTKMHKEYESNKSGK